MKIKIKELLFELSIQFFFKIHQIKFQFQPKFEV